MKNNTVQLHFSYRIGGVRIKVFQTGKGLRLKNPFNAASDVENLRGIHSHFTYEAFFVTEGKLELVTDRDTAVYERKIVIIPPKLRHYSFTSAKGSFCLLFTLEETGHTLQNTLDKGICTLEMEEDSAFYIIQAARKLEQQNPVAEREAKLLIELLFNRILSKLQPEEKKTILSPKATEHMNTIEQYINGRLSEKITLGDVAKHVYLSPRQVSRIVAKEWGCSLVELVTEKKLAKVQILLKNTDMKIAEIAVLVNVGSSNYFYALFKRRYGMSPLQFRKIHGTDR